MEETRNLCARIPLSLHQRICSEREKSGLNNNLYVTGLLEEYYAWKDNGGGNSMAQNNENTRTMAFQISETLFQRIKSHLDRESKRRGIRLTQKDFVLGLIEAALDEAEREAARTEETAAEQSGGAGARPEPGVDSPNREPDAGDAEEGDSGESAPTDAVEDADSADGSRLPEGR